MIKNVFSAPSPSHMHANARCGLRREKIKFSKILEIDIFKFIFGISFKNLAIQAQTRPYSYKDLVNPCINLFGFNFSFQMRVCQFAALFYAKLNPRDKADLAAIVIHKWLPSMEYTLFQDFAHKIPRPAPPTGRPPRPRPVRPFTGIWLRALTGLGTFSYRFKDRTYLL